MNIRKISKITSVVITIAVLVQAASCSNTVKQTESTSASDSSTAAAATEAVTVPSATESMTVRIDSKSDIKNIYSFEKGVCKESGKLWSLYFYESLGKLDAYSEQGELHSVYGPASDSMLGAGDSIQFTAINDNTSRVDYRHLDEKSNRESCTLGVGNHGGKMKAGIDFVFEEGWNQWEDGTGDYKFLYKLSIDIAPGEFDKVFVSKEAFADNCWLMLGVLDGKNSYHEVWFNTGDEELKKMFEDEGCTYYTKDQIIDKFWNDHSRILESIDYGMSQVADTSLSDAGINWKK